jgi:virulence-associated protein VapD
MGKHVYKGLKEDIRKNYLKRSPHYYVDKYGYSLGHIYSIACELGVTCNKRWDGEKDAIIKKYLNGKTLRQLGREYGHFKSNVLKHLVLWGIKIRDSSECKQQYRLNQNYFDKIDSHEKAYWLGFIYADGNVYLNDEDYKKVFQVALARKDSKHLTRLKRCLDSSHPIYHERTNDRFLVNNIHIVDQLQKCGVNPKKSLILTFPSNDILPNQYLNSFVLGYFDGDGSISSHGKHWNFQIIGTKPFLEKICLIFSRAGVSATKLTKEKRSGKNKIYYLSHGGTIFNKNVRGRSSRKHILFTLYGYLYSYSPIWLQRKRRRFEKYLRKMYGNGWNRIT